MYRKVKEINQRNWWTKPSAKDNKAPSRPRRVKLKVFAIATEMWCGKQCPFRVLYEPDPEECTGFFSPSTWRCSLFDGPLGKEGRDRLAACKAAERE